MESDLYKVIEQIQYMNDNGWFAAHLTDLLYSCEKLKIMDEEQAKYNFIFIYNNLDILEIET